MSAIVTKEENGVAIEDVKFDFGETKVADVNSKGDLRVNTDKKAFVKNAGQAGITKGTLEKVFKYVKAHNEALVDHATKEAPKHFKKNKDVKRVIVTGGYGIRGTSSVTIQKEKVKPVGALGSGKTITEPYVSFKCKDTSLPSKDLMKAKVADLIKAL